MTIWCGSESGCGSADPCLRLIDPDSDPDADQDRDIYVIDFQDADKKLIFLTVILLIIFWRYIYIIVKDKKSKRSHKIEAQKHVDPVDPDSNPDPQHCFKYKCRCIF